MTPHDSNLWGITPLSGLYLDRLFVMTYNLGMWRWIVAWFRALEECRRVEILRAAGTYGQSNTLKGKRS